MTPQDFVAKWQASAKDERRDSHSHFIDLCALLGVPDPANADPAHEWFCFERGAAKTSGGSGWADVWRRDCFGWEYKGGGADLRAAHNQLLNYAVALGNPPLLIVSDMNRIIVHTNWTNTVGEQHEIGLPDLLNAANRDLLRNCFLNPEALKPQKTRAMLTEEAAQKFVAIAQRLQGAGATTRRPSPISSTASSSACSPRMWACCPTRCSSAPSRLPGQSRNPSPPSPATSSPRCAWAASSAPTMWRGSTAASSTMTMCCR